MLRKLNLESLEALVERHPRLTHAELAIKLGVSQPTVTRGLKTLGYARRHDGRLARSDSEGLRRGNRREASFRRGRVAEYVESIELIAPFVIVKTLDGAAQLVRAELEAAEFPWIVATLVDRDILLVVLRGSEEQLTNRMLPTLAALLTNE